MFQAMRPHPFNQSQQASAGSSLYPSKASPSAELPLAVGGLGVSKAKRPAAKRGKGKGYGKDIPAAAHQGQLHQECGIIETRKGSNESPEKCLSSQDCYEDQCAIGVQSCKSSTSSIESLPSCGQVLREDSSDSTGTGNSDKICDEWYSRSSTTCSESHQRTTSVPSSVLQSERSDTWQDQVKSPLVKPWKEVQGRFVVVRKLELAGRNQGAVWMMADTTAGVPVATKVMPNSWVQSCPASFAQAHPYETENPWQDMAINYFLDSISYPYAIGMRGVYSDEDSTRVVYNLASHGDLFGWASKLQIQPGIDREAYLRPIVMQLVHSVKLLHELSICHRDLSLENILVTGNGENLQLKLIDFSTAQPTRFLYGPASCKFPYGAPEMYANGSTYDGYLADTFAVGVVIYCILLSDYPWMSTKPPGDKAFQFYARYGWQSFAAKKKCRKTGEVVQNTLSAEALTLLQGLLEIDPSQRLTLGETVWQADGSFRRSAWQMPWMPTY